MTEGDGQRSVQKANSSLEHAVGVTRVLSTNGACPELGGCKGGLPESMKVVLDSDNRQRQPTQTW